MESLIINTPNCHLDEIDSFYFSLSSKELLNVEEGVGRASEREFRVHHLDRNNNRLSIKDNYYISRIFLSYYEAHQKLFYFWQYYAQSDKLNIDINQLDFSYFENICRGTDYGPINFNGLSYANEMKNIKGEFFSFEANPFKEYLYLINLNTLLAEWGIEEFPDVKLKNNDIFNSSYLFKAALKKKNIASVLYEWANINSINQSDFIKRISNILETIERDVKNNKSTYQQIINGQEIYKGLLNLLNIVSENKYKRKYFHQLFNATEILGTYSRHGAKKPIVDIQSISRNSELNMEIIVDNWLEKNILPSDAEFEYLFRMWYLITSLIVLNWLRVKAVTI